MLFHFHDIMTSLLIKIKYYVISFLFHFLQFINELS